MKNAHDTINATKTWRRGIWGTLAAMNGLINERAFGAASTGRNPEK
jgi:hypothetical protein